MPENKDSFSIEELEQLEKEGLKTHAELLIRKLSRIREALALETDPSRQFRYEIQIEQTQKEIAELKTKLA